MPLFRKKIRDPVPTDSVATGVSQDLRSLRVFIVSCALAAIGLFAAFAAYRNGQLHDEAEVRLTRALAIAHEHALRVLETDDTLLQNVLLTVRNVPPDGIRERSAELHSLMQQMHRDRQQHVQSIWLVGPDGRPQASSRHAQPPAGRDISGLPYFQWHRAHGGGVFASGAMKEPDGLPVFNISRGRYTADGQFAGLVSVGIRASYFTSFHRELAADEPGLAITLFRQDGVVYSRWPELANAPAQMSPRGEVLSRVLKGEKSGTVRSVSSLDGQNRVILFRQLGEYPIYLGTGRALAAIHAQWLGELARVAMFVMLPVFGIVLAAYIALRRTREALESARRLQEEAHARRVAEEALLQSQKMEALGRLTGGVAHDFNNALMVISGNVHLLRLSGGEIKTKYTDAILRAISSATQLTRQLLAFSRRQALAPQAILLQERLPALGSLLAPVLGSQVKLDIEVAPGTRAIFIDPAELELGVLNLAVNARDAMPLGGRFSLRALGAPGQPDRVLVEVADTGEGMDAETLRKAFEPFYTTKPIGKGTGLGLSQVQALCKRAGGDVHLESEPGEGTLVRMIFPATDAVPPAAASAVGRRVQISRTVLVVEDNQEVANVILPVLQELGCRTIHHASADLALGWLEQNGAACDVLLTDVVMPGRLDGVRLASHVKEVFPHVKVLLMTGYAEQIEQVGRMGFQVIAKPFGPDVLADTLDGLLAQAPAREPADA